ncbi:poly(R)-hydroxyalkanoic acid synthase subunit PhaE [Desulfobacterales bacterium HSG16]|nr:poly(R)-hydroxyalkanoic acid synthase subunit PhaE [Desulfobacterales bacterium HSG16]
MDQNKQNNDDMQGMYTAWTKFMTDFWKDFGKTGAGTPFSNSDDKSSAKFSGGIFEKTQKTMESNARLFQAMASMFTKPENLSMFFQTTETLPEFMLNVAQQSWETCIESGRRWSDRASAMGQTDAYNFDDLDHETFENIRQLYEREVQKYLNIPQLGLTRGYQEKINRLIDKQTLFSTTLQEFMYLFFVPIEKSHGIMQEKIEQMVEDGEIHDDYKQYYSMWIKILEGHYMALLQSPEYTKVMNKTIKSLTEYKKAKEEILTDVLQQLPVPTNHDMDELYKDLYLLKKKVMDLSEKIKG